MGMVNSTDVKKLTFPEDWLWEMGNSLQDLFLKINGDLLS